MQFQRRHWLEDGKFAKDLEEDGIDVDVLEDELRSLEAIEELKS